MVVTRRQYRLWCALIFAGLMTSMAACRPITANPGSVTTAPATAPAPSLTDSEQQIVDSASAQLAQQLGVPPQQIELAAIEPVEWPDASLGCPQAGMMYAAVVTPGYRVIFDVDGEQVEVHTSTQPGDPIALCQA